MTCESCGNDGAVLALCPDCRDVPDPGRLAAALADVLGGEASDYEWGAERICDLLAGRA